MKTFSTAAVSAAAALLSKQINASPAAPPASLSGRQAQVGAAVAQIVAQIVKGGKLAFPEQAFAWDYNKYRGMCMISMETTDGANCYAKVTCDDGEREYNAGGAGWNVCFQGGRQYFSDPRIGDFSITFTTKDVNGQGLTGPVLQLADVGNWQEIPVQDLADAHQKYQDCDGTGVGGTTPKDCAQGPYLCTFPTGNNGPKVGRTRKYACGMPKRGKKFEGRQVEEHPDEEGWQVESNIPAPNGYAPGQCGVHITQYQKPEPSKDEYSLAAQVFDANEDEVARVDKTVGPKLRITSKLPKAVTVTAKAVDGDALTVEYDGIPFDTVSPFCVVGGYDSGKREIDCGFLCN